MASFDGLLSIIIPVFNEENTIMEILRLVQAVPVNKEIIIVDDFSTDLTRERLKTVASEVKVILHDRNKGKGAAIRTGLQYVSGDAVIIQDADMEYNPQDIVMLLDRLTDKKPVVYGSRFLGQMENMSGLHLFGNRFLTAFTNLLFGIKITDMETCYKLMARQVYTRLDIQSERFNMEPEITAKIAKMGYEILEVPISYNGRGVNEGKKISWKDGFSAVAALIKYRYGRATQGAVLEERTTGGHT